jgi:uncharacterized membrane protein YczE
MSSVLDGRLARLLARLLTAVLVRRAVLLLAGLALYGASLALLVVAELGVSPWDVFHQGVSKLTGVRLGAVLVLTSFAVLLAWIPLRVRPGVGTIANAVLVGVGVDVALRVLPDVTSWGGRFGYLVAGVVLNGVATGMYIGAGFGPGPRDGLMTGIARRGHSIRVVRTTIEVGVLLVGVVLGGTVGIGTVVYALAIGPLAHLFLPIFSRLTGQSEATPPHRARTPPATSCPDPRMPDAS